MDLKCTDLPGVFYFLQVVLHLSSVCFPPCSLYGCLCPSPAGQQSPGEWLPQGQTRSSMCVTDVFPKVHHCVCSSACAHARLFPAADIAHMFCLPPSSAWAALPLFRSDSALGGYLTHGRVKTDRAGHPSSLRVWMMTG